MLFELDDDQKMLAKAVRDFAREEILPHVMKWDEAQTFPRELFTKMGQQGYLGVVVPEELGGAGMSYQDYVIIVNEISRICPSIGLSVAAHNSLGTGHILAFGSDATKKKYIPKLASGEWIAAWGLTEAGSGSDAASLKMTATRDGDHYVLNGTKVFCTHAGVGQVAVVMVITDKTKGKKGITAFAVEIDGKSCRAGKKENKLGMRASDTCELIMEDCRVPVENRLGEEGQGFVQAMQVLDGGRISIAANSLGCAWGAYDAALKYAKERQAFGGPISQFQAVQFTLADMATRIEAARLLTMKAAAERDAGVKGSMAPSFAKLYASELAVWASERGVQIHGGYGYIKDFPAEKYYRDSKLLTIGEGTSEIQRLVIARELVK